MKSATRPNKRENIDSGCDIQGEYELYEHLSNLYDFIMHRGNESIKKRTTQAIFIQEIRENSPKEQFKVAALGFEKLFMHSVNNLEMIKFFQSLINVLKSDVLTREHDELEQQMLNMWACYHQGSDCSYENCSKKSQGMRRENDEVKPYCTNHLNEQPTKQVEA